jgi:hypothetical protein
MAGLTRAFGVAAALVALSLTGCSSIGPSTCDRSVEANPWVDYREGTTDGNVYETSPLDGELLYFPGGMHYRLHHGLGKKPDWVLPYLSFERFGTTGGPVAPASGNEVEIAGEDADTISVNNGSCVEYWLLVKAGVGKIP